MEPTCLICCSEEINPQYRSSQFGDDELSKNLEVVFILKTIFEVPPERLQYFLSSFAESGSSSLNNCGINLCCNCTKSVDNVKQTYNEMQKAVRLFQQAKYNIIEQVKASPWQQKRDYSNQPPSSKLDHLRKLIVKETRQFVCKNNYKELPTGSPFKSGDLLANQLVHQNRQTQKIRQAQPTNPNRSSVFQSLHLSTCPDHNIKKPHYQCQFCPKDLSSLAKLKTHVIRYHSEHLFISSKLPNISEEKFKECCTRLLNSLTKDLDTPGSHLKESKLTICCTECRKGFTDKRYLHCHWIMHHFPLLCVMLQDIQENKTVKKTTSAVAAQKVSNFKCIECAEDAYFPNVHELQSHAVNLHPEQFFPEGEFNSFGISSVDYKICCKKLFKCVNIRKTGNESFGCSFCSNCYVGHLTIKLHLVTSHWDLMAKRLREILEGKLEEPEGDSEGEGELRVEIKDKVKVEQDALEMILLEDDVEETYERLESYFDNIDEDPLAL